MISDERTKDNDTGVRMVSVLALLFARLMWVNALSPVPMLIGGCCALAATGSAPFQPAIHPSQPTAHPTPLSELASPRAIDIDRLVSPLFATFSTMNLRRRLLPLRDLTQVNNKGH